MSSRSSNQPPPNRRRFLLACCAAATPSLPGQNPQRGPERLEAVRSLMGTQFRILVFAADPVAAGRAILRAVERGEQLNARLSDYLEDSELNQLCRAGRMQPVSEDLFTVLAFAHRLSRDSRGAFDVTLGPLIRLWRDARRNRTLPAPTTVAEARRRCGYRHLSLHAKTREVRLRIPGMQLDLGGIAKGYAAGEMLRILRDSGFPSALVAASGDLAIGDPPPASPGGWRVELGATGEVRHLSRCGVSTSGDESQFVDIGGVRYSHIVDPATGLGLTRRPTVTVIAPTAMEADALATASAVLGGKPVPRHPQAAYIASRP